MYYKKKTVVNYYDCDVNNSLKISAAIRLMQQTSSEHLETIGVSVQKLYEENQVFLLTKTSAKVHSLPKASDEIIIGTAAIRTKGPRFYREFTLEDTEGNHYMDALTLWILVEPDTRKILRPSSFAYGLPFQDSITQNCIDDIPFKIEEAIIPTKTNEKEVAYSLLDINGHVNNSYYADFICDLLPYHDLIETGIDNISICYQNEALYGEHISINTYQQEEKVFLFQGSHGRGTCFDAYIKMK